MRTNGDLQFVPLDQKETSPPFPSDVTPTAISILEKSRIPLWMFADMTWSLSTTSVETNTFFHHVFQSISYLPNNSSEIAILLASEDSSILITAQANPPHTILLGRALHPANLLAPALYTKRESPSPPPPENPFLSAPTFAGQFISVVSPQRGETSCSQFDAKLESPGRVDAKTRRERQIQNLLPDIARRRKAELENPLRLGSVARETSLPRTREGSVVSRTTEVSAARTRETSIVRPSALEMQTKQVVKQTVLAALRLHSISTGEADYKLLVNHTVAATMFALRQKMQSGKSVGMGEIGGIVEGLLELFVQ
jgi:hypothetical protein